MRGPTSKEGLPIIGVGMKTFSAESKHLTFRMGTPVICHGLKNAKQVNGKLGCVRSYDLGTSRYGVHFEDSRLKPVKVKQEKLRIVFDLPDSEK